MKLIIIIILISTHAFTQITCDPELKRIQVENLANINQEVLNTVADCSESDDSSSLCSLEEEKIKYNTILAKLVLARGLDALKQDIEISYKEIQNVSSKKIAEAKKSIEDFEIAIAKTEVLTDLLKVKNGKRLLNSSNEDIEEKMNDACIKYPSETCEMLGSISKQNKIEIFKFVNGYSEAFQEAYLDDRDHDAEYRNMLSKLTLKYNGQNITASNFKQTKDYKNIQKLKNRLSSLSKNRSEENAKKIVALSNTLKDLNVNFGNNVSTSNELVEGVKDHLQENLSQLSNAYTILTKSSSVKKSIKDTKKLISDQSNIALNVLARDIKDNYSEDCEEITTAKCIKKLKQTKPDIASEVINRFNKIITSDLYSTVLSSAQKCLETEIIQKAQAECIDSLKQNYPNMFTSNIADLEEQLEKSRKIIQNLSNIPSVSTLEKQKLIALTILKQNNCFDQEEFQLTCNNSNINDHATINLTSDLSSIITQISLQDYKNLKEVRPLKEVQPLEEDEKKNREYLNKTKGLSAKTNEERKIASRSQKLNSKQIKEKKRKVRFANKEYRARVRAKKREERYIRQSKNGNSAGNFFNGLTTTVAMGVPQLVHYRNQRAAIQNQRAANRRYYDYYTRALRNQNNYFNQGLYMNWGANAYNPNYSNNFNYLNPNLYRNTSNPYQFTYGTNNLGLIRSSSTYNVQNSSSPGSSTPFTFSF